MNNKQEKEIKTWKLILIIFVCMITTYLLLVQIWDSTSEEVKPKNFLDLQVKTPVHRDDWFTRNENGV